MQEDTHIQQIKWRCRRGMLELDMLLAPFAEKAYPHLTDPQKVCFRKLLTLPDPEILGWLMGKEKPQGNDLQEFQEIIRLITDLARKVI